MARPYFFDNLDSEVAHAIEGVLTGLAKAGSHVRDVRTPVDGTTMARVFDPIVVAEIHQTYERDWRERPQAFSSAFAEVFKAPLPAALELAAAYRQRLGFQMEMTRVFDEVPTWSMVSGAVLIVSAGLFIIWRERKLGLQRAAARKVITPQG